MRRGQSAQIKTPEITARLTRDLSDPDRQVCRDLMAALTLPDRATALAEVPDPQLLDLLRTTRFRADVIRSLQKLGVTCPQGRLPRSAGMLRMRLRPALTSTNGIGHILLLQATDAVMTRLIALAANLEVDKLVEPERLDTSALRTLTVAATAPIDPSLPLVLLGLSRHGHPYAKELLPAEQHDLLAQFAEQISEEGWAHFESWATERTGLVDPNQQATTHDCQAPSTDTVEAAARDDHSSEETTGPNRQPADAPSEPVAPRSARKRPGSIESAESSGRTPAQPQVATTERAPGTPTEETSATMSPGDSTGLRTRLEQLPTALAGARAAHERLAHALTTGARPDRADLTALHDGVTHLQALHDEAASVLASNGTETAADLLILLERADDGRALVLELAAVSSTTGGLEDSLSALRTTINGLLDRWPPTGQQDLALAEALTGLHALINEAASPLADDDDMFDRAQHLLAALPGDLRKVVTAANRGRLTLGDAATPPAGTPAPEATVTESAPAAPSPAPPTATSVTTEPTPHDAGDGASAAAPVIVEASALPTQATLPARPPAQNKHEQPVPLAGLEPTERHAPVSTTIPIHATGSLTSDSPAGSSATGRTAVAARASAPAGRIADAPPVTTTADAAVAPVREAHDDVLRVVGELLQRGRLGLAHHLLEDAEHGNSSFVIMLAALARRLRTKTGPCALELVENSELADNDVLTSDRSELLAAAALVKAALVTGNTHLAQLLHDLLEHLPTAWARLARLTSEAVSSGALTDTGIYETADPSALELATSETAAVAQRRLSSQPKLREHRAQTLLARLRAPGTDLGAALAVAARNDASGLTAAQQVTADLTRGQIHGHVLAEDQKLRQGGKALPTERIEEITEILLTDRDTVARWASAVARAKARITDDRHDWGHGRLLALHEHITQHHAELHAELDAHIATGPLGRGQSAAAAALLADVDAIVHGQSGPPDVEPSVLHVLHMELLKLVGATLDVERGVVALPDMEPADRLAALMNAAAEDSWEPALRRHLDNDDYDAALRCAQELDRSDTGDHLTADLVATDPAAGSLHAAGAEPASGTVRGSHVAQVHEARPRRLQQLKTEAGALRMLLVQARRGEDQSVQDTVDASLGELELLLDTADVDLRRVRDALQALEQTAGQLRDATVSSLLERLDSLDPVEIGDADRERLRAQIAAGDYVAVDDEITNRQLNKRLPDYGRPADLLAFFPHVPAGLPDGITNRVLETIRGHGTVAGLDFAADAERAGAIADLLAQWRDVGNQLRPGGSGWHRETSRNLLVPVLVAVGLQAPSSSSLITLDTPGTGTHGKGWRFVELRDATHIGKAMVPAFGSQANRRYRLLLAYDVPDVRTLTALRDSDGSDSPLVICYFGTLSPDQRMELARDWADPTMRPTIVLDDAALTYVLHARAELSGSLFATLMNVTLPFTTTSPFSDIKSEDVPVEMFYGRDREKRRIEAMAGESLLYGGRNLGKSALLRTIKKAADSGTGERKVVMLQLPRDEAFGAASELWGELVEALEREGFTTGPGMSRAKPQARVERMVENWLTKNPQSQLLIMLDEVDGFFNADAQVSFHETTRLFQLKERNNRLKIVFAGLHSVNHFHGTGNVPFSPAGALAIGPLDPADAYRLLTGPMHAMGYAIEPAQARRIMMHCNYQPYLIQMFAHRLLEQLHLQRPTVITPPPWTVTSLQIERVMHDPSMRSKISRAFTMTLELDKRFQVIVNLLALHAYDGKGAPLSGRELYDDCRQQWPEGFAETSMASFLELLNELEGLGVVGPQDARGGRPLRSSALLPSLGSRSEIEHNLAAVADLGLTENQARGLTRPALDEQGRPGPLTTDQLATLAGRVGNRTHVLIGSAALGLPQVEEALTGRQPALRKIVIAPNIGAFRKLLKTGGTGETRMTVVSELWKKCPEVDTCQESLEHARSDEYTPEERNAHRAAVLIAGTENGEWLEQYLCDDPSRDSDVVPMERFSARSLPLQWRDRPKLEELGSPELAPRLLEVTGGWPALVDQVVQRTLKANAQTALDEAEQRLEQPSWPMHFLQATGAVGVSEELTRLVGALVEHDDPADDDDLALLTMTHGITDLDRAVTLAEWFSLIDRDRDGRLCLAPLIARAWANQATT